MFLHKIEILSLLNKGGKKGFALNSDDVGVGIVLTLELSLCELILKLWSVGVRVGVPVRLGGSDCRLL